MTTTGASVSRALCIGIIMTAITGPVFAAYDNAVQRNYDTDPSWFVLPYVIIGLALFAVFAPAMTVAIGHSSSARHVWLSTAWLLVCLAAAHIGRALLHNVAEILLFPAAGVAAMFGALWINGLPTPARPFRRRRSP